MLIHKSNYLSQKNISLNKINSLKNFEMLNQFQTWILEYPFKFITNPEKAQN